MPDIVAEMVANVLKVEARIGQEVAEGDTLVLLESMKMEMPVLAPSGGRVVDIRVDEGDTVHEGDVIAVVES